ncbi:hypothetical protein RA086_11735 [Lactiplantibacillus sp. WILCCON 0030]|uniref:Integral membrane protein n=1 Tax=Lactiplantibacillus brownii TaxID=3069269 RepID=A0ABU1ABP4_9LACO|nr:hypothetical protein [Lactiplantibacillus brownii]MDQ7938281.1 hypothetical protein [Lactiplantibacillus brownii]
MVRKSGQDAWHLLWYGIGFALLTMPFDWLIGRPLLHGLIHEWLIAETESRWAMLGFLFAFLIVIWLVFFLIGISFRWLNQQISKHDWMNRKR